MGITLKAFINKYFYRETTKEALENIGESTDGSIEELENKLATTWTQYRDVYDLLDFLDEDDLMEICDHFGIETEATTHSALKSRIKKSGIITNYIKTNTMKNKSKKNTDNQKITSNVKIIGNNINFGNNKINSENKINSDNTFYSILSDKQRKMFILGIIAILVPIGIVAYQSYETSMANWNDPNSSESSDIITNDISGDDNTMIIGDGNIVINNNGKYAEINSTFSAFLNDLVQQTILEQQQSIKKLQEKLLVTTNEKEHFRLESIIDKLQIATYSMENGDFAKAENYYRLILDIDETNTDALEGLGLSFGRQEKYDESIFYYNQLLGIEPDNYEALINNAWSYSLLKEYDESISLLNDLENKDPDDMEVLSHKCWVLHKLNLHSDAIDTCKKVISSGTYDDRVTKAYSLSLSLLNRSYEALPFHEKLYRTYPNDFATLMNYANALSDVGQIQESLKIYNEGLEKFPNQKYLEQNKKVMCANNPQLQCE